MANLDGTDDVFDSRDVIERIAELEAERFSNLNEDEKQELIDLRDLASEAESVSDWQYGETFISGDYFTEYTRELLTDVGYIPQDFPSWIVVDWDETADNVRQDYTPFDFRGTTYWARA